MPRCQAIKQDGVQCAIQSTIPRVVEQRNPAHLHLCTLHRIVYFRNVRNTGETQHIEGRCFNVIGSRANLRWCPNHSQQDDTLCETCRTTVAHRMQRAQVNRDEPVIARELAAQIADAHDPPVWQHAARMLHDLPEIQLTMRGRRRAAMNYYRTAVARQLEVPQWQETMPMWRFVRYWEWLRAGRQGVPNLTDPPHPRPIIIPPTPPLQQTSELARIARDAQNVHTTAVTNQTNTAEQLLLGVHVPDNQHTEKCIAREWMESPSIVDSFNTYLKVANDMNRWFNMKSCRNENDMLYRCILRGLVAMLNRQENSETKRELYKRLWEECQESVGMCCEGHISRLCNVLVGFNDAFEPPISIGELLQNKMAAIANLDIPTEMKYVHANAIFDEYAIPQTQRLAWLEAF